MSDDTFLNPDSDIRVATDMFTAKWGFGPPAPAYQREYDADVATLAFLAEYGSAPDSTRP